MKTKLLLSWVAIAGLGFLASGLLLPRGPSRAGGVIGVAIAVLSGALALGIKARWGSRSIASALGSLGIAFVIRALAFAMALVYVRSAGVGREAYVAGFLGTYFVLQWIELGYVLSNDRF